MNGKTKLAIGSIAAALVGAICFSIAAVADASSNASSDTTPQQALMTKVAENLNLSYDQVLGAFDKAQQEMSSEALQQRLTQAVNDGTITQDEADQITAWMNAEPAAAENLSPGWLNGLMRPSGNFSGSATSNLSAPPDRGKGFSGMEPSGNYSDNARPRGNFYDNMSQGAHDNHMRPSGNSSDNAVFNQSNTPGMGKGFLGMRTAENSSEYIQKAVDNGIITQAQADEITAWINAMPDAMTKIGSLQHNGHMGPSDPDFCLAPF
jgi:hypothetical protein